MTRRSKPAANTSKPSKAQTPQQNDAHFEAPWNGLKAERAVSTYRFKKTRAASKTLPRQNAVRSLDFPWDKIED